MTFEEIAKRLGVSSSAVRNAYYRAKRKLRRNGVSLLKALAAFEQIRKPLSNAQRCIDASPFPEPVESRKRRKDYFHRRYLKKKAAKRGMVG